MISITDHIELSYELYSKIVSDISNKDVDTAELIKCLPGVGFDVFIR